MPLAQYHRIVDRYPYASVPWGTWTRARASLLAPTVPNCCTAAFRTFLLLAKRLGVIRDVAYVICEFICTRSRWRFEMVAGDHPSANSDKAMRLYLKRRLQKKSRQLREEAASSLNTSKPSRVELELQ